MNDEYQQTFSFMEPPPSPPPKPESKPEPKPKPVRKPRGAGSDAGGLRRAVLGWLASFEPTGMGMMVPTRISHFQADVAAFWSKPAKHGGVRLLCPVKTVAIEVRHSREQCWPDCARKDELLALLRSEKETRKNIEAAIRQSEPGLRTDDNLFPEFENWDYRKSSNKDYHKCLHKVEELERSLYNGSRFERIRRAAVADFLYLAVPEGSVHPDELADSWGLLYVAADMSVKMVKEADKWECPMENKLHLTQNVAATCLQHLLFAKGVIATKEGKPRFITPPRRRRS